MQFCGKWMKLLFNYSSLSILLNRKKMFEKNFVLIFNKQKKWLSFYGNSCKITRCFYKKMKSFRNPPKKIILSSESLHLIPNIYQNNLSSYLPLNLNLMIKINLQRCLYYSLEMWNPLKHMSLTKSAPQSRKWKWNEMKWAFNGTKIYEMCKV